MFTYIVEEPMGANSNFDILVCSPAAWGPGEALLKNSKLEEQLSLRSYLVSFNFDQIYLVNLCPIFVNSLQNLSDSCKKNSHLGLISDQNWSFS